MPPAQDCLSWCWISAKTSRCRPRKLRDRLKPGLAKITFGDMRDMGVRGPLIYCACPTNR
jgi:hypothetical protein